MKILTLFIFITALAFSQVGINNNLLYDYTIDYTKPLIGSNASVIVSCYAFKDSSITLPCSQNVWQRVTNTANTLFTSKAESNCTNDSDTIVINTSQKYVAVFWELSMSFANGDVYKARVLKNGTEGVGCATVTGRAATLLMCSKCVTSVEAGDYFELQIINTSDNSDPTVVCGRMVLTSIL